MGAALTSLSVGADRIHSVIKPVWTSFSLLHHKQKIGFIALVASRMLVHFLDVLGLAAVGLLGSMVATGFRDGGTTEFFGFEVTEVTRDSVLVVVAAVAGFFLLKSALASVLLRLTTVFLAQVEAQSARDVAQFLFSGTLEQLRQFSRGDIQWAVSQSSHTAFSALLFAASALFAESALFVAIFVVFIVVDAPTALLVTAYFLALLASFQLLVNRRLKRVGEKLSSNSVGVVDTVNDLTDAYKELSVLSRKGFFLTRFGEYRTRYSMEQALQRFLLGLPRFFVEAALMVGILALVTWQFRQGSLEDGLVTVGIFLTGGVRMMAALLPLQNALADIRTLGPQAARAHEIIRKARRTPEKRSDQNLLGSTSHQGPVKDGHTGIHVQVSDVSFRYENSNVDTLQGISLDIRPGAFVALVGPSGSGKTTLADLILGLHSNFVGDVSFDGMPAQELRGLQPGVVGYVPQRPGLVSGTLVDNIALGIPADEVNESEVSAALDMAELASFVNQLPRGIHSELGKQSESLSGGQVQRIGLARALYHRPRLLVLDEATSALDAETEATISKTIRKLLKNTTVIVIAHRLSTIQDADRVFVVRDGRITAQGTFPEVRKLDPGVERYVQLMRIGD